MNGCFMALQDQIGFWKHDAYCIRDELTLTPVAGQTYSDVASSKQNLSPIPDDGDSRVVFILAIAHRVRKNRCAREFFLVTT